VERRGVESGAQPSPVRGISRWWPCPPAQRAGRSANHSSGKANGTLNRALEGAVWERCRAPVLEAFLLGVGCGTSVE